MKRAQNVLGRRSGRITQFKSKERKAKKGKKREEGSSVIKNVPSCLAERCEQFTDSWNLRTKFRRGKGP